IERDMALGRQEERLSFPHFPWGRNSYPEIIATPFLRGADFRHCRDLCFEFSWLMPRFATFEKVLQCASLRPGGKPALSKSGPPRLHQRLHMRVIEALKKTRYRRQRLGLVARRIEPHLVAQRRARNAGGCCVGGLLPHVAFSLSQLALLHFGQIRTSSCVGTHWCPQRKQRNRRSLTFIPRGIPQGKPRVKVFVAIRSLCGCSSSRGLRDRIRLRGGAVFPGPHARFSLGDKPRRALGAIVTGLVEGKKFGLEEHDRLAVDANHEP